MNMRKLLTLACLTIIATPLYAFNLDSLLIASIGGHEAYDSLQHLTSFRAEGAVNLNGQQGRFVEYFVPPTLFYIKVTFEDFSLVQAYDGQTAWQTDQNGKISELEGFEKREMLKNIYFESFAYLWPGRLSGDREYQGRTVKDGQTYHKVAFYPLNTDTVLAYYDYRTGLRKLMVSRMDNIKTLTYIDKYKKISGILFPFYSKATAEGILLSSEFEADTVELNARIDTSIFSIPAGKITDYHFPTGKQQMEIPFQYKAGHIKLLVTINGRKKVWFILDSGASANIYHKPVADELNLPVVGTLPARGISGFENVEMVKTDSIAIGQLTLYNQMAGSLDLSLLERKGIDGEDFGGLLGYDFISRFPVMINYQESMLVVYNPNHFEPSEGGVEVGFHLTMQVPTVRGELNGIPGDFLIDLGNAFGLIIHHRFVKLHNLDRELDDIRDNPSTFSGIGGDLAGKTAFAATFQIGDILIQSLRVILPDSSSGLTGSDQLAGNIGNLIMENFKVLFDYGNSRLIFYDTDK